MANKPVKKRDTPSLNLGYDPASGIGAPKFQSPHKFTTWAVREALVPTDEAKLLARRDYAEKLRLQKRLGSELASETAKAREAARKTSLSAMTEEAKRQAAQRGRMDEAISFLKDVYGGAKGISPEDQQAIGGIGGVERATAHAEGAGYAASRPTVQGLFEQQLRASELGAQRVGQEWVKQAQREKAQQIADIRKERARIRAGAPAIRHQAEQAALSNWLAVQGILGERAGLGLQRRGQRLQEKQFEEGKKQAAWERSLATRELKQKLSGISSAALADQQKVISSIVSSENPPRSTRDALEQFKLNGVDPVFARQAAKQYGRVLAQKSVEAARDAIRDLASFWRSQQLKLKSVD